MRLSFEQMPFWFLNNYYGTTIGNAMITLGVILAIVFLATFLRKGNEGRYKGKAAKIYNLFNFNRFYAENILRITYVIAAFAITFYGLYLMGLIFVLGPMRAFLEGLFVIVIGNLLLRLVYELIVMFIILVRKTVSIDKKMDKMDEKLDKVLLFYDDSDLGEDWSVSDEDCNSCGAEGCSSCEAEDCSTCGAESCSSCESENCSSYDGGNCSGCESDACESEK